MHVFLFVIIKNHHMEVVIHDFWEDDYVNIMQLTRGISNHSESHVTRVRLLGHKQYQRS